MLRCLSCQLFGFFSYYTSVMAVELSFGCLFLLYMYVVAFKLSAIGFFFHYTVFTMGLLWRTVCLVADGLGI